MANVQIIAPAAAQQFRELGKQLETVEMLEAKRIEARAVLAEMIGKPEIVSEGTGC